MSKIWILYKFVSHNSCDYEEVSSLINFVFSLILLKSVCDFKLFYNLTLPVVLHFLFFLPLLFFGVSF